MWEKSRQSWMGTPFNSSSFDPSFYYFVWVFSLHVCLCTTYVSGTLGDQKRASNTLSGCDLPCERAANECS